MMMKSVIGFYRGYKLKMVSMERYIGLPQFFKKRMEHHEMYG